MSRKEKNIYKKKKVITWRIVDWFGSQSPLTPKKV